MTLVKSKQRVADHGEVFTPAWMFEAMFASAEDSLFAHLGQHEIFTPAKTWPPMTVGDLAAGFVRVALAPLPKEAA